MCTASLVGPDLLLTNGHCIPPELRSQGASCQESIWVHFLRDRKKRLQSEKIECLEVLYSVDKEANFLQPDYALLRLTRATKRPVLKMSRGGLAHGERLRVYKMDPVDSEDGLRGVLKLEECRVVHGSAAVKRSLHERSLVTQLADCEIIPGNSGSPLLTESGDVKGVVFARLKGEAIEQQIKKELNVRESPTLTKFAVATNFACLHIPLAVPGLAPLPAVCASLADDERRAREAQQQQKSSALNAVFLSALERAQTAQPSMKEFNWVARPLMPETKSPAPGSVSWLEVEAMPTCVRPGALESLTNDGLALQRPRFLQKKYYDSDMIAHFALELSAEEPKAEIFRGKEVAEGAYEIQGTIGDQVTYEDILPPCP
jgi:hypothetical protein